MAFPAPLPPTPRRLELEKLAVTKYKQLHDAETTAKITFIDKLYDALCKKLEQPGITAAYAKNPYIDFSEADLGPVTPEDLLAQGFGLVVASGAVKKYRVSLFNEITTFGQTTSAVSPLACFPVQRPSQHPVFCAEPRPPASSGGFGPL